MRTASGQLPTGLAVTEHPEVLALTERRDLGLTINSDEFKSDREHKEEYDLRLKQLHEKSSLHLDQILKKVEAEKVESDKDVPVSPQVEC